MSSCKLTDGVVGPAAQLAHLLAVDLQVDIELLDHTHRQAMELYTTRNVLMFPYTACRAIDQKSPQAHVYILQYCRLSKQEEELV